MAELDYKNSNKGKQADNELDFKNGNIRKQDGAESHPGACPLPLLKNVLLNIYISIHCHRINNSGSQYKDHMGLKQFSLCVVNITIFIHIFMKLSLKLFQSSNL